MVGLGGVVEMVGGVVEGFCPSSWGPQAGGEGGGNVKLLNLGIID